MGRARAAGETDRASPFARRSAASRRTSGCCVRTRARRSRYARAAHRCGRRASARRRPLTRARPARPRAGGPSRARAPPVRAPQEEFYETREEWLPKKETLEGEYDFINLPYFYEKDADGKSVGPKLTQSTAILRFLGRKHGLCGKTEEEIQKVDMVFDELRDVSTMFGRMCYNPEFGPELKKGFLETVPAKLKRLDKFFTAEYAAGPNITIADFQVRRARNRGPPRGPPARRSSL